MAFTCGPTFYNVFFCNFVSYPTTFGSALSRLGKHVIGFPCPFFVSISKSKSFRNALLHHSRGYTAGAYATHIRLTCPGGSWIEVLVCFLIQFFWFFSFYFLIFGTLEGHVGGGDDAPEPPAICSDWKCSQAPFSSPFQIQIQIQRGLSKNCLYIALIKGQSRTV